MSALFNLTKVNINAVDVFEGIQATGLLIEYLKDTGLHLSNGMYKAAVVIKGTPDKNVVKYLNSCINSEKETMRELYKDIFGLDCTLRSADSIRPDNLNSIVALFNTIDVDLDADCDCTIIGHDIRYFDTYYMLVVTYTNSDNNPSECIMDTLRTCSNQIIDTAIAVNSETII